MICLAMIFMNDVWFFDSDFIILIMDIRYALQNRKKKNTYFVIFSFFQRTFFIFQKKWQNCLWITLRHTPKLGHPNNSSPQISNSLYRSSPNRIRATDLWFARPECYTLRHDIFLMTQMKVYVSLQTAGAPSVQD